MSELITCRCGHEYEVSYKDQQEPCYICGGPACEECRHQCGNPSHTKNEMGCEACMIFSKELGEWFCCHECLLETVDPYGFWQRSEKDKQDMSLAVLEILKKAAEAQSCIRGDPDSCDRLISEARAMLATAASLYLVKQEEEKHESK